MSVMSVGCIVLLSLAVVLTAGTVLAAELNGRVIDENGVAIAGAKITVTVNDRSIPLVVTTDEAGLFALPPISSSSCLLRVEKLGYYAFVSEVTLDDRPTSMEITLNRQQEFEETVNVVYSTPTIDPEETAAQTTLTSEEITDLPFSATHDFRNALPLIPGVYKDNSGRLHMNGGGENQALYSLDGFNITSPVSGTLQNRISVDAIRAVRVETSRYSAEFGKGSAGVMALETGRGDDHFRFSATNFLPSYEFNGGLHLSNWTPRATLSGPIVKGRAWYFNALDLQYDLNTIEGLPSEANTNRNWWGSNMTVVQLNLTGSNILTTSLLVNFQNSRHLGLTPLDPVETSRNRHDRFYFFNIKDQAYFTGGWVLETGIALNSLNTRERPLGGETYTITPQGRSGNYFQTTEGTIERVQAVANVVAPAWTWKGQHRIKFGIDANRIRFRQFTHRRSFQVERLKGSLARLVDFSGNPSYGRDSSEFSAFGQDRWSLNDSTLVEAGMRFDWDQILRQPLVSPRLAVTWGLRRFPESKFTAGIGIFYDAINLGMVTRAMDQQRSDTFFAEDGQTIREGPILSRYVADERILKAPYYLNWSLGWEQRLPRDFYFRTSFIRKHGRNGWSYDPVPASAESPSAVHAFELGNVRRDSFRYLEFTVTRTFAQKYNWLVSYARSSARSSAVIDYSLENPIYGRQGSGPLDWDIPNRLISWGLLPTPLKKYTVAYFLEWHSGFPFSVVNDTQQLVGSPNSHRFPEYFSLNVHFERRFRFWRHQWALRAGFNNITSHENATVVNNNIAAAEFGEFGGGQGRVFTGRIRFLGKN